METKEHLVGFYLIDVPDLDTALDWAAKMPIMRYGTVEVRPVMEGQAWQASAGADRRRRPALERAYREEWTAVVATLARGGSATCRRPRTRCPRPSSRPPGPGRATACRRNRAPG